MGGHVTVLSHSPGKREDALGLGADDFLATKDESVFKENASRFNVILDTVSAQHEYNAYLGLLRRDGAFPRPLRSRHLRSLLSAAASPDR
jgi:uncharacterized zinc-type alcohol dehydrogenase-like protein